jgi:hypothetical protein
MALTWDVTGVENYEKVCLIEVEADGAGAGAPGEKEQRLNPVTNAIIWMTMGCGVGWGVTAENVEEFEVDDDGTQTPRPVTGDEIRAHVGLRTNVAMEPRVTWLTSLFHSHHPKAEDPSYVCEECGDPAVGTVMFDDWDADRAGRKRPRNVCQNCRWG